MGTLDQKKAFSLSMSMPHENPNALLIENFGDFRRPQSYYTKVKLHQSENASDEPLSHL